MKRLRMATKLALAIIPIALIALAAGALVSRNALDRADNEERASLAAEVAADAMDSLVAFSAEHALALEIAVGSAEGGLETRRAATDAARCTGDRYGRSARRSAATSAGSRSRPAATTYASSQRR